MAKLFRHITNHVGIYENNSIAYTFLFANLPPADFDHFVDWITTIFCMTQLYSIILYYSQLYSIRGVHSMLTMKQLASLEIQGGKWKKLRTA